jgi:hypothetical protein
MDAFAQNMPADLIRHQPVSRRKIWVGRILSGLVSAFLLLDGAMKLALPAPVVKASLELGYPASALVGIGVVLLACTILYLIPRTAILGAVLLTGYLGGAVATHVRVSAPLFNVLFPVIFGCLIWIGLYLRDTRLKILLTR